MEKYKCCLCSREFEDWGNNPWPIVNDEKSRCCNDCDTQYVIPARLIMMSEKAKLKKENKE